MNIKSTVGNNPRLNKNSIWVGVDIDLPISIANSATDEQMVSAFCRDFLGCRIENIVWAAVNKSTDNGITYSIDDGTKPWVNTGGGFIYATVDLVMEKYCVNKLDACIVGEVDMVFDDNVKAYTNWINNRLVSEKSALNAVAKPLALTQEEAQQSDKDKFYASHTNVPSDLADAIVEQFGGWDKFKDTAHLVYGNGILAIENFTNIELMTEVYHKNQELILGWLYKEAIYLDYEDVSDMLCSGRDGRVVDLDADDLKKYTEAELTVALYNYEAKAHKEVANHVVRLVGQMFCFDMETFREI